MIELHKQAWENHLWSAARNTEVILNPLKKLHIVLVGHTLLRGSHYMLVSIQLLLSGSS